MYFNLKAQINGQAFMTYTVSFTNLDLLIFKPKIEKEFFHIIFRTYAQAMLMGIYIDRHDFIYVFQILEYSHKSQANTSYFCIYNKQRG